MPFDVLTECLPDVLETVEACHLPYATSVNDQENAKGECSESGKDENQSKHHLPGNKCNPTQRERERKHQRAA